MLPLLLFVPLLLLLSSIAVGTFVSNLYISQLKQKHTPDI
jgi:uncharacterized membrane protein YwzB